jgi:peptidoglycan/LPS O-acetylase OafA/YrhL
MSQTYAARAPRSIYLDFVRGLAVLGILFYHICPGTPMGFGQGSMELFFVISGFLITQTFSRRLQNGFSGIASFTGSRLRRLMPALIAYVILVGVVSYFKGVSLNEIGNSALFAISGLYNWYQIASGSALEGMGGLWSLAIEDQYYYAIVLLGVCIIFAGKQHTVSRVLIRFYIVCASVALIMRIANTALPDVPTIFFSYNTFSRLWGFALGGLAALFALRLNSPIPVAASKARVYSQVCFAAAVVVLLTVKTYEAREFLLGWLIAPVLFGASLLLWSLATKSGTKHDLLARIYGCRIFLFKKHRWVDFFAANVCVLVARIGVACYSIYLFQMSDQLLGFRFPWLVSMAWAVGVGFAIHMLLERRFYRFPEYRFVPVRS